MATEVKRFNSYLNNTPCCVTVLNDGTLALLATNGLPSAVLTAAYLCASAEQRARLQAEADVAIVRMTSAEWAAHCGREEA